MKKKEAYVSPRVMVFTVEPHLMATISVGEGGAPAASRERGSAWEDDEE